MLCAMDLPQLQDGCPECGQDFGAPTTLYVGGAARGKVPALPREAVECPNGHRYWVDPEGLQPRE
jgi:hypothetical protein